MAGKKAKKYATPFETDDRVGKPCPRGPVDPVAVWTRAREILGITTEASDEEALRRIKGVYSSLCANIAQKGEDVVLGELDAPDDVSHRMDWRRREGQPALAVEQPIGTGQELVMLGETGRAALSGSVEVGASVPTEAA